VVVCLRAFPIFQLVFDGVFLFSADTLVRFFYNHNPIPILFPSQEQSFEFTGVSITPTLLFKMVSTGEA